MSKSKNTAKKSSSKESPTVFWMPPPSSGTSENSSQRVMPTHIREWLMSLPGDSPARIYPLQGKGLESKAKIVDDGKKWSKSLAEYAPLSHSWKTAQCLLFVEEQESLQILPDWGMTQDGELLEITSLGFAREASDSGYLLMRPTATDWKRWAFKAKSLIRNNHGDGNLSEQLARVYRLKLSPLSAEILMAWPEEWTALKPLETDKFRSAWLTPFQSYLKELLNENR